MLNSPETKCSQCQAEIYKGDNVYWLGGKLLCEECFCLLVTRNPPLLANALGIEVEVYGRGES